jgi:hypothetical protein
MRRAYKEPEYRWRIRQKAEQDHQKSEKERQEATQKHHIDHIILALHRIKTKIRSSNDENTPRRKRDRGWYHFWDFVTALGLWAAASVGVAAICIGTHDAKQQRTVMQGQLNEMIADRRPWVSVEPSFGDVQWDNGALSFVLRYEVRNTGKSPALAVALEDHHALGPAQKSEDAPLMWLKGMKAKTTADDFVGFPLFPGEEPRVLFTKHTIDRTTVEQYRDYLRTFKHSASDPDKSAVLDKDFLVFVEIAYIVNYGADHVDMSHHRTFCWAQAGRTNAESKFRGGLALLFNQPTKSVGLTLSPFGCGAD